MKFRFDFVLEAWIRCLEVEASSEEEAMDIFNSMSITEMLEEGYVKDFELRSVDKDLIEETLRVRVFNIKKDAISEGVLPEEIILDVTVDLDCCQDEEIAIEAELIYQLDCCVDSFEYEILERR